MIFFFSGTGNSEWVAQKLAEQTGDKKLRITKSMMKLDWTQHIKDEKQIGFVFPIYAWAIPKIVLQFINTITLPQQAFRFIVCTCGDEAGYALNKLKNFDSYYSIIMPNNYIIGYNVDSKEVIEKKVNNARKKIREICDEITAKNKRVEIVFGALPTLKTWFGYHGFDRFMMSSKPFYVENSCNSCGLCEKICPVNNIKFVNDKPVWGNECQLCLGCIHRCPMTAIQYGNGTKKKGRYYFSEI